MVVVLVFGLLPGAKAAVDLLNTEAAAAFKAGEFERAATEFAGLIADNPGDVTLLRFLGITLRKLERYQDSATILQEALDASPENVAVNYHLAVTLLKAGAYQSAMEYFRTVLLLEPESRYAELATEHLNAISDQIARLQRPTEPERFSFYAQLSAERDSNLLAIPDNSAFDEDEAGSRFSGYLSGGYNFVNRDGWLATLDVSAYRAGYDEERFDTLDVSQLNPGLLVQKAMTMGRFSAVNGVRYDNLDVDIDGESYSSSDVLTLTSRIPFTANTRTRFSYAFTRDTFDDKGFDPLFSSRDADNHRASVVNTWFLRDRSIELDLGLGYSENSADGVNFNYDAWEVQTALRFSLPRSWWLDFGLDWKSDSYPDFAGPIRRETDILDSSLSLRRWFRDSILVQFNAAWHDEDSSYDSLTYDRYTLGINVSYVY